MTNIEQIKITIDTFTNTFGIGPQGVWKAPGRINLIGEHTDYNQGLVLPFAIEQSCYALIAPRKDSLVRVSSIRSSHKPITVESPHNFDLETLTASTCRTWLAFPKGICYFLSKKGMNTGADIAVLGQVPIGSGLSSSAALACAIALGLNEIYSLGLTKMELVQLVSKAENIFAGVPAGIMDPAASLLAVKDHLLFLDTDSECYEQVPFLYSSQDTQLILIDTNDRHRLSESGYALRRQQCKLACEQLGVKSLREITFDDLDSTLSKLDDPLLRKRVAHVVTENQRVISALDAVRSNNYLTLGSILTQGHMSLKNYYEVSTQRLDLAVDTAIASGALGARMTGGGFGGSVLALAPKSATSTISNSIEQSFSAQGFAAPTIYFPTPCQGAFRLS